MEEDDDRKLEKYFARATECFEQLVVMGVKMDLVDLVVPHSGGDIDSDRFRLHTEPKSPGTGLRYVRMLERLIRRHEEIYGSATGEDDEVTRNRPSVIGKAFVLEFIEELVNSEAGFRTPQAVLYAMEFFSIVFGFEPMNRDWARCKKLADNYAAKRPPRSGADYFQPEFLEYLELGVLDINRDLGQRTIMGRLRLCAQASVRHNDLLNTPLSEVEWCRTRGTTSVRGLRSRSLKGKTGPRPWVASFMGMKTTHDEWLITLMELMLQAHGESWKKHKFFGVKVVDQKYLVTEPPSIQHDAAMMKKILRDDLSQGRPLPLSAEEIEKFRWHGCKATLTTYMQHYNIPSRAIRHAGNWSKKGESMPDLYLRESQLLVLKGQEERLLKIRKGEKIGLLEGRKIGVDGLPTDFQTPETEAHQGDRSKETPSEPAEAMVVPEFRSGDLREEFRDAVYADNKLLEKEVEEKLSAADLPLIAEGPEAEAGSSSGEDSDLSLEGDPNMFGIFLVGQGGKGKIHKVGNREGRPFCGSSAKSYATLLADEALDGSSSLCLRCFGPVVGDDGCETLCSFVSVDENGEATRCGRRCVLCCEKLKGLDTRVHRCMMHARQE